MSSAALHASAHTALPDAAAAAAWLAERVRGQLRTDSRSVLPGDGFIAWPGYATDGRRYLPQALAAGAVACVIEADGSQGFDLSDERIATLPRLKAATGALADAYFAQPSAVLDVVATTGTNGKTSTAWWTAQALTKLGRRSGVIGTLGVGEPGAVEHTGLTTPDPITLHESFRGFVDKGFAACALEASSIGIVEERLAAARIDVALFTNFTQDHLDYHGSMAAYWAAKRQLFAWPGLKAAVVNVDDPQGSILAGELSASAALDVWTVSLQGPARLRGQRLHYEDGGLAFELSEGDERVAVQTALVGEFNASNVLVVMGALRALGVPLADAAAVAGALTPVPGRVQRVNGAGIDVVIDYAHTPDALAKVLQALRPLASARGARLWCVFGCGGNRDASKRPLMGAIAAEQADHVIVTSDNPRLEDPASILAQVRAGIVAPRVPVQSIEDRRAAIRHAVLGAAAGDVVLLAGKGHEDYQDIGGVKLPFADIDEARAAMDLRDGADEAATKGLVA